MKFKEFKSENIIELLPRHISLTYVDRNEDLDERFIELQTCLSQGSFEHINCLVNDWYGEQIDDSIKTIFCELKTSLIDKYNIKKKKAKKLVKKFKEEITNAIYDNWNDDTLECLLNNTSDMILHYDTGYEMEGDSWKWTDKEIKAERIKIKKHLGIPKSYTKPNDAIEIMIAQATYGGSLLIYFNMKNSFIDFIKELEVAKTIVFEDYMFGIVDHCQGSGDVMSESISKYPATFELLKENIFFEKSIKYNWTYSIAGMCNDWADDTAVTFKQEESENKVEVSEQSKRQIEEEEYNETFKRGACTPMDMDMGRHRKVTYINTFHVEINVLIVEHFGLINYEKV